MLSVVKGLVLRTVDVRDGDRMMTVYTAERGLISVYSKGAKSVKGRKLAASSELCYSEMTIFESGDKVWLRDAAVIRSFVDSTNPDFLPLAMYVLEVVSAVATAEPDRELLRLALNTLHALESGKYDFSIIKGAFEIRLVSHIGFMPNLSACSVCGRSDGELIFDLIDGVAVCGECKGGLESDSSDDERHPCAILTGGARIALEYAMRCPQERLFSFSLSGEDMELFRRAAEGYLLNQLERGFNSLDYYHAVTNY